MFRRKDVELLLQIKHLLYERKFTIEGARKWLHEKTKPDRLRSAVINGTSTVQVELFPKADPLPEIRREVADILNLLKS
jgi:hypothetical protein